MYSENNELAKLFLNIEKLLIDFRLNKLNNVEASYAPVNTSELTALISSEVRRVFNEERVKWEEPVCGDAEHVPVSGEESTISTEVIKEKVLEITPKSEKKPATSKGGSVFKVFEPLVLDKVTEDTKGNEVVLPDEDSSARQLAAIRAALS